MKKYLFILLKKQMNILRPASECRESLGVAKESTI